MYIIDLHTHIYPENIAKKATESVKDFYHLGIDGMDGTSAMLLVPADPNAVVEEPTEAPAEPEAPVEKLGFFASVWKAIVNFFGNLFGKK